MAIILPLYGCLWPHRAYFGFLSCLRLGRSACYERVTTVVTNED